MQPLKIKRTMNALFPLTVLIAFSAALAGILADTTYSLELPSAAIRFISRDYIVLIGVLPLSIITFLYRLKGTMWSRASLLGISLYLLGAAGFNLFSLRMSGMFFLYAAVLAFSLFTVLIEFPAEAAASALRESSDFPGKRVASIALFYLVVSILQFWTGDILPALIYRQVPESVKYLHVTVNVSAVFDLCLMVPLMVIGAVYLWRGKPRGIVTEQPAC